MCDKLTCKLKCNDNDNDYDDDEREEEMVTLKTHFRATFHFLNPLVFSNKINLIFTHYLNTITNFITTYNDLKFYLFIEKMYEITLEYFI